MKALCWEGVNELAVRDVPAPRIENQQDIVVKVTLSAACGSSGWW